MLANISDILKKAVEKNDVISVFTDMAEKEKCSVGFIELFDKEALLIKHITPCGEADGFAWRRIEDIYRIDIGGLYENKLKMLYNAKRERHDKIIYTQNNILSDIICFAGDNNKVVEISIDENNDQEIIVGLVKSVLSNETIIVEKINDYGELDGTTVINLYDIVTLNFDSKDSRDLMLLLSLR